MKRSSTGKTQPESPVNPWLSIYHLVGGFQICEPFPGFSEAGRSFRPDGRHLRHPKTFGGWCGYQHLHVSIYLLMVSSKVWHKAHSSFTSLQYGTGRLDSNNCIQLFLYDFMINDLSEIGKRRVMYSETHVIHVLLYDFSAVWSVYQTCECPHAFCNVLVWRPSSWLQAPRSHCGIWWKPDILLRCILWGILGRPVPYYLPCGWIFPSPPDIQVPYHFLRLSEAHSGFWHILTLFWAKFFWKLEVDLRNAVESCRSTQTQLQCQIRDQGSTSCQQFLCVAGSTASRTPASTPRVAPQGGKGVGTFNWNSFELLPNYWYFR